MADTNIDQVIVKLSKIEKSASDIKAESEKQKSDYAKSIQDKIKDFDENLNKQTDERLKELSESLEAESEKELVAMQERTSQEICRLEKAYEINSDKWVEGIFNQIVGE